MVVVAFTSRRSFNRSATGADHPVVRGGVQGVEPSFASASIPLCAAIARCRLGAPPGRQGRAASARPSSASTVAPASISACTTANARAPPPGAAPYPPRCPLLIPSLHFAGATVPVQTPSKGRLMQRRRLFQLPRPSVWRRGSANFLHDRNVAVIGPKCSGVQLPASSAYPQRGACRGRSSAFPGPHIIRRMTTWGVLGVCRRHRARRASPRCRVRHLRLLRFLIQPTSPPKRSETKRSGT